MEENISLAITDGDGSGKKASVKETNEIGIYGLVITNPDGSNIMTPSAERLGNLGIDVNDATYFYFGYTLKGGTNWRIKRMKKSDFAIDWAEGEDNPGTAWSDRIALTYSIDI